jgi:hypothetical protein
MVEKHKNIPPGEKETFPLAFKKLNDNLAQRQDQKLERLQAIPRRLPDAIIQPKVTFIPGRKRALTGREAAERQEREEARERRRAQIQGEKQLENDTQQAQAAAIHSQFVADVAAAYADSHGTKSHDIVEISSEDELEDIRPSPVPSLDQQVFKSTTYNLTFNSTKLTTNSISRSTVTSTITISSTSSTSTGSCSSPESPNPISKSTESTKSTFKSTTASSSNRPTRARKPSAKQASQNRCTIEKEEKKRAHLAKKPKTTDTTQLDKFELPFWSSQ